MRAMKRFLTWMFWIVAVLLLLFFGTILIGTRYARKVAPWPDPVPGISLTPARPFLAASNIGPDNAYFYFLQLTNFEAALAWDSEDIKYDETKSVRTNGWVANTSTNLEAWIATNQMIFELFAKAATGTNAQAPTIVSFDALVPEITASHKLQRVLAYEAARNFGEGRSAEGVSTIAMVLHANHHMDQGQCLIGRLVAVAGDQLAMAQVWRAARAGQIDGESNERLVQLIAWRDATREPFAETMRYELLFVLDLAGRVSSGSYTGPLGCTDYEQNALTLLRPFLPVLGGTTARMREHIGAYYSHAIAAEDDPRRLAEFKKRVEEPFESAPNLSRYFDDPVGRFLMNLGIGSLSRSVEQGMKHRATLRTTGLMLAVEQWRMDHGDQPPGAVGDLVPKYLGKVPEDPFAKGSNLLYRVDGESYVVYSVGADGDDGRGDVEGSSAGDVGWRVRLERGARE